MNSLSFHIPVFGNDDQSMEIVYCLNNLLTEGVSDVRIFFDTIASYSEDFNGGSFHASELRNANGPVIFTSANRCLEISRSPFRITPYYLFSNGQNIRNLMKLYENKKIGVIVKSDDLEIHKRISANLNKPIVIKEFNFCSIKEALNE